MVAFYSHLTRGRKTELFVFYWMAFLFSVCLVGATFARLFSHRWLFQKRETRGSRTSCLRVALPASGSSLRTSLVPSTPFTSP